MRSGSQWVVAPPSATFVRLCRRVYCHSLVEYDPFSVLVLSPDLIHSSLFLGSQTDDDEQPNDDDDHLDEVVPNRRFHSALFRRQVIGNSKRNQEVTSEKKSK